MMKRLLTFLKAHSWLASLLSGQYTITMYHIQEETERMREKDIWVEMPPLSTEKVVMQARDMGFGESLAFLEEDMQRMR